MYGPEAAARRQCLGSRADGQPCRGWALWDAEQQLCAVDAGRHHLGPLPTRLDRSWSRPPAPYKACTCAAYRWPQRPGGGLCRWPLEPIWQHPIPAGTHSWPRLRCKR